MILTINKDGAFSIPTILESEGFIKIPNSNNYGLRLEGHSGHIEITVSINELRVEAFQNDQVIDACSIVTIGKINSLNATHVYLNM